jgi:hypothetical protein
MNASKTKESKETKSAAEKPLDPFAVDFFGEKKSSPKEEKTTPKTRETRSLNGNKNKTAKALNGSSGFRI